MSKEIIRTFETGANRDVDYDKLDFEGFMNPRVLNEFGKYMHKNRYLKDGSIRDSDNWQKGFGEDHKAVCMKSLWRHFMDLWMLHRGYKGRENIDEAICGIMFNTMAYYNKILDERNEENK